MKVFPEGHREGYFLFMKLVATGYWLENTYKADKNSKTSTAEQLSENITGGKYAYHFHIPPTPKTISINIY